MAWSEGKAREGRASPWIVLAAGMGTPAAGRKTRGIPPALVALTLLAAAGAARGDALPETIERVKPSVVGVA